MKRLVLWLAKKHAIGYVQDLVAAKSGDVKMWAARLRVIVTRVRYVLAFLDALLERLEDGELTVQEADRTIEEFKILGDEVTAKIEVKA